MCCLNGGKRDLTWEVENDERGKQCLPEIWVHLLVGVEPKDTTKPKSKRGKDILLAASKEYTAILLNAVSP